ncbi:MAG: hypothetical protein ACI9MC_000561 [Kiritimatiellia bacterium]|jgi:hypothetical protein
MSQVEFESTARPLKEAELAGFEARWAIRVPGALRSHMLVHHGGRPKLDLFEDSVRVAWFYTLDELEKVAAPWWKEADGPAAYLARHKLPFGYDEGNAKFCVDMNDGAVTLLLSDGEHAHLADSFGTFLAGLDDDDDDDSY